MDLPDDRILVAIECPIFLGKPAIVPVCEVLALSIRRPSFEPIVYPRHSPF